MITSRDSSLFGVSAFFMGSVNIIFSEDSIVESLVFIAPQMLRRRDSSGQNI
jgi:hypothetical protein